MKRGAYRPGGMDVQIEHVFCGINNPWLGSDEVRRIRDAGRVPMVTVEPKEPFPYFRFKDWADAFRDAGPVCVRYMHEPNGDWYPWGGVGSFFVEEWTRWHAAMPRNVQHVWCMNVSYPGSAPIRDFWPDPDLLDWIGLDGYARNGESMAEVFAPTLEELHAAGILRHGKPLMIAETGTPRGRGQAKWWRDGMWWAARQGIAAVLAFSEDKSRLGGDERDWSLSKAAQRAFLGG